MTVAGSATPVYGYVYMDDRDHRVITTRLTRVA